MTGNAVDAGDLLARRRSFRIPSREATRTSVRIGDLALANLIQARRLVRRLCPQCKACEVTEVTESIRDRSWSERRPSGGRRSRRGC
jgi:hypothetical protein